MSQDLSYLPVHQASRLIQRGDLSPVDLTRAYLDRIRRLDSKLNLYTVLLPEQALAEARVAEAEILHGRYRGPLHGIPVAHKDLFDIKGVRTTAQSKVYEKRFAKVDSTVAARLRKAGAIHLGKLAMGEFAAGSSKTALFDTPHNPWNLTHYTGGSSGGSAAAVTAGLCAASYGTDTGGSIRSPSSFNGVVGLKPTYGRVSRYGVIPLSYSCDHCGPLTRTAQDNAIMLQAVAGHDPLDPTSSPSPVPDYLSTLDQPLKGLKVGVLRDFYTQPKDWVVPEVLDAVDTAIDELKHLGCTVRDVKIPCLQYTRIAHNVIMMSEGLTYHVKNLRAQPQNYGPLLRALLLSSAAFSAADYVKAQQVRAQAKIEFMEALQSVDVLVSPTANNTAPLIQDPEPIGLFAEKSMTSHYDLTGLPAVTLRCGFSSKGLPIGLQIAGRPFDEATILRAAHHYQQATPWHHRCPPI
ncbi:MAG: hypothetical protein FJ320_10885 [SAR202 cluster bacterium]|nr:hypothetical protein [SAR202 cluster bacterium]